MKGYETTESDRLDTNDTKIGILRHLSHEKIQKIIMIIQAAVLRGAAILQGKKGPAAAVSSTRGDRGRSHARGGLAAIVQRKFMTAKLRSVRGRRGLQSGR